MDRPSDDADDARAPTLRRIERGVEDRLRELVEAGELAGLPGEGAPLPDEDAGTDEGWAARHVMRTAQAVPAWVDLRRDIDARIAGIRRRQRAHREWLRDRTLLLAELPADRLVEAARATAARDALVRDQIRHAVSEVNALIRRYDLLVVPSLQLTLVTV